MYLRALGSLLTRRSAHRGIPRAQAESSLGIGTKKAPGSAAGKPARSLHSLRDLAIDDGTYGAGAAATAALAGFVALLYFNKDIEKSAGEVTSVEATKEVPHKEALKEDDLEVIKAKFVDKDGKVNWSEYEEAIKAKFVDKDGKVNWSEYEEAIKVKFVDKDGKVNWSAYIEHIDNQRYCGGKVYDKEVFGKEAIDKVTGREDGLEDLKVDEEAMRARFDDWMKKYRRSYKSEEEKARRYEIFKKKAMDADRRNKRNASKPNGARFATNEYSDWTEEEWMSRMGRTGDYPWEEYFAHRKSMIAEGRVKSAKDIMAGWRPKTIKDASDKAIKN